MTRRSPEERRARIAIYDMKTNLNKAIEMTPAQYEDLMNKLREMQGQVAEVQQALATYQKLNKILRVYSAEMKLIASSDLSREARIKLINNIAEEQ